MQQMVVGGLSGGFFFGRGWGLQGGVQEHQPVAQGRHWAVSGPASGKETGYDEGWVWELEEHWMMSGRAAEAKTMCCPERSSSSWLISHILLLVTHLSWGWQVELVIAIRTKLVTFLLNILNSNINNCLQYWFNAVLRSQSPEEVQRSVCMGLQVSK